MPLDDVKTAQALTGELLKPGNLKPGLEAYLNLFTDKEKTERYSE